MIWSIHTSCVSLQVDSQVTALSFPSLAERESEIISLLVDDVQVEVRVRHACFNVSVDMTLTMMQSG